MKKALAIILSIAMLFCVLSISTVAEETPAAPSVTLVTNAGSPVAEGITTYFTVKFNNFSSIKGVDVTISADQKIVLQDVIANGFKNAAGENVNYTENNDGNVHTIRFVDLTAGGDARITFGAKVPADTNAPEDPEITITGKYADSGKTLFEIAAPEAGNFELKREIATTEVDSDATVTAPAQKFIPYGGVYTVDGENYTFVDKNDDGTFSAPAGAVYQTYDVPGNGITTFGASDDIEYPDRLKFGSYSTLNGNAKEHGTLLFEGDWLELKNHYIKKGYTVQQFVEALYKDATTKLAANPNATHVIYRVNGKPINVYRFIQNNYMWKGGNVLEYSIRLQGVKAGTTYTAVAYSIAGDDTVTISENVKSVSK